MSYLLYSGSQVALPSTMDKVMKAAFQASRLTPSTFLIKEYDDIYSEHPHIYAKIVPSANTILVVDTGCGGASNDTHIEIKSLRDFIETVKVDDNNGSPLNEGGRMDYIVALTHCHYDHILGVEDFRDSAILASAHSPSFLEKDAIPEHSLCRALSIKTPQFTPTLVPHMHEIISSNSRKSLGVKILHTPGHTPDEIALYDEAEMMVYVGDSLYEWEPIIFPREGSIVTWFSSINYLISFVKEKNHLSRASSEGKGPPSEVLINSGHCTALQPALEVLQSAKAYMQDVVEGREIVQDRRWSRGEEMVTYGRVGDRFSLRCPERLVREAQKLNS
ncbi:hypothetical protein GALMADRAFT_475684 [Galerina marginata CBS 339.88]|uniref:Metallo-beta-lactamase domain-containing protein n=1 Tax=Galerina marginata (strain CBS 339.88) TaxID=685588 RepID=A0A067TBE3_GALM3|nr:hypothetical protein GALMADRAFT_475684 [Galerina marginata CBS 339.88]